jgi:hypothetical protein
MPVTAEVTVEVVANQEQHVEFLISRVTQIALPLRKQSHQHRRDDEEFLKIEHELSLFAVSA